MRKKVSLLEIVAVKIVFAVLFALIYWMWSRNDYQVWYQTLNNVVIFFVVILFWLHSSRIRKYKKEEFDELAERNLKRCDSICFKIFIVIIGLIAFAGGVFNHIYTSAAFYMGWVIVGSIIFISILRTVLFLIMDRKGV